MEDRDSPSMPSSLIQTLLEDTLSNAILIHDACGSADTAVTRSLKNNKSVTELIAACGFEAATPSPSPNSFARALIDTLRLLSKGRKPFSVSGLFNQVVARLRNDPSRSKRITPVHCILTSEESRRLLIINYY
jgi:hypothetical protein